MSGYQGWFNCPEDGMDLGWKHWRKKSKPPFGPGNVSVDLWPDVSELGEGERYETGFRHADGRVAEVFSSADEATVGRHFEWMREYEIDGVFLQRFASGLDHEDRRRHNDRVLANVRKGAESTGRVYAMMYDLSGLREGEVKQVAEDWARWEEEGLTKDRGYLHHDGKPVVAVWGVGFGDDRQYTLDECDELVEFLKERGCTVMLGVPTGWRTLERDSVDDPRLHEIIRKADIISPWTVGRYRSPEGAARHGERYWAVDAAWCEGAELEYLPVVFPGFSWHNLNGEELGAIPRLKGKFLWSQFVAAKRAGSEMVYVAMFDEVDEGTAIFKCTNDVPVGEGVTFLGYEGLPPDHYLWLTGKGAELIRGELPLRGVVPKRPKPVKKES
ncbi:MAG: glycoside hydrolase family 71/99-like protein [Verrucomicrobiota bacterium]